MAAIHNEPRWSVSVISAKAGEEDFNGAADDMLECLNRGRKQARESRQEATQVDKAKGKEKSSCWMMTESAA